MGGTDLISQLRDQIEEEFDYSVDRLMAGTALLDDELTVDESGLALEQVVTALIDLEGGKRKRKKKDYKGRPKKIKHKHKPRAKALLEYYNVEESGKVKKMKHECTKCEVATYMADHPDRHTCGRCGFMYYRLTADGQRLPIPKQNKPSAEAPKVEKAAAKKDDGKKKKKKG